MRPASLAEPQGAQVLERHVAEQVHDAPVVPIFDALVPLIVDQFFGDPQALGQPDG